MTDSVASSQISLISLQEIENTDQTERKSSPQQKYDKSGVKVKSKPVRKWLMGRRKRKIGNTGFQTHSNNTNHSVQEVHVQTSNGKANGVSPQANTKPIKKEDQNESREFNKDDVRYLRWLKSVFQRKEKKNNIDINSSNEKKFKYFGFLIPALVFQPTLWRMGSTPIFEDKVKLELAAAHIDDAIHGHGKFGKARASLKSITVQRCYQIISSRYWEYLLYFFIALHSLMLIWEQSPSPVSIGESWNGWEMNVGVLVTDAICITVYGIDIALHIVFLSWRHFWKAKENLSIRVEFIFTLLFFVDFIILILEKVLDRRLLPPFRCFRAAMLVCKSKNVAHIFKVLLSIMTRLGKVFAIIFIFILTFASIGLHLYLDEYHIIPEPCINSTTSSNCSSVYSGAFDHVAIASLHMFVLMSTENYPDIIIPAYDVSWVNFFYFMFYLYAGVFFLTAILLAIIVESYWEYSKKHVKMERLREREELVKAWNLLDQEGSGFLSVDDPKLLKLFRILRPKNSDEENKDLIRYISSYNQDFIIDSFDWTTRVVETLSIEFEPEEDENPESKRINLCPCGKIQKISHKIIHAQGIGPSILVMILLHSVLFALMWSGIPDNTQLGLQILRSSIIFIFILEVILRIISDGSLLLNILDLLDIFMVIVAIAGNVIWYVLWFEEPRAKSIYLGASIVASSLAVLARLLFNSEQARSAVHILRNIYPVMFDLILLVITIIFFYAVIGLEIFQDKSTEKSEASGFEGSYIQYGCGVGFDTFGCALLIVFQIVTTNDWHQIMLGAMTDTGWASSLYFVSCYLIINMIVMNLFVAISIEAYKKLARDGRDLATQPTELATAQESTDAENPTAESNEIKESRKKESIKNMAKSTLTGLFASSRSSRSTSLSNPTSNGPTPYMGRRGTRGSIGTLSMPRTPKLDLESSDDDLTMISRRSIPGTPMRRRRKIVSNANTSEDVQKKRAIAIFPEQIPKTNKDSLPHASTDRAYDKRQGAMKARSDKRRLERKALKQQQEAPPREKRRRDNVLQVPQPKLSISDIVRLKKTVQVIRRYNAKDNSEMSVSEGQIIAVTESDDQMYHGPNGWFPKTHASEIASLEDLKKNSPTTQRKTAEVKNVNFKVENEKDVVDRHKNHSSLAGAPLQHRPSQVRMRMKIDGEDWRRKIHGDMTVMNRDEMQELNRQLKGGLRQGRSRVNPPYQKQNIPIRRVEEIIEENDEMPNANEVPQVTVSEVPQIHIDDENGANTASKNTRGFSVQDTLTLTVPEKDEIKPTGVDEMEKKVEMPDWMKNFVAEKGLEVAVHKFDESTLPSGSSDDEDQKMRRILVHRSDTNTNDSSLEHPPPDKDKSMESIDKAATVKNKNINNARREGAKGSINHKRVTIPGKSS